MCRLMRRGGYQIKRSLDPTKTRLRTHRLASVLFLLRLLLQSCCRQSSKQAIRTPSNQLQHRLLPFTSSPPRGLECAFLKQHVRIYSHAILPWGNSNPGYVYASWIEHNNEAMIHCTKYPDFISIDQTIIKPLL